MTELLERALDIARRLPAEMQDEMARMILLFAGDGEPIVQLTPEEDAALELSEAAAARGEFASDAEVEAMWAKYRL